MFLQMYTQVKILPLLRYLPNNNYCCFTILSIFRVLKKVHSLLDAVSR